MINSSYFIYYFNIFSKNLISFILLFCAINIEISLNLFSFFDFAPPSLLSIIIYISIRKFSINYSNFVLFTLGLIYDILLGVDLGTSSMFFLLIKYLTNYVEIRFFINNNWFYFTFVFIISFLTIFLINTIFNLSIPDLSPLLFHVGVTLTIFPFILIFINFINSITNLFKSDP